MSISSLRTQRRSNLSSSFGGGRQFLRSPVDIVFSSSARRSSNSNRSASFTTHTNRNPSSSNGSVDSTAAVAPPARRSAYDLYGRRAHGAMVHHARPAFGSHAFASPRRPPAAMNQPPALVRKARHSNQRPPLMPARVNRPAFPPPPVARRAYPMMAPRRGVGGTLPIVTPPRRSHPATSGAAKTRPVRRSTASRAKAPRPPAVARWGLKLQQLVLRPSVNAAALAQLKHDLKCTLLKKEFDAAMALRRGQDELRQLVERRQQAAANKNNNDQTKKSVQFDLTANREYDPQHAQYDLQDLDYYMQHYSPQFYKKRGVEYNPSEPGYGL